MSWLRLLAAGKSLVGLSDGVSPYRVRNRDQLPKFEAASNPFRATVLPSGCGGREMAGQARSENVAGGQSLSGAEGVQPTPRIPLRGLVLREIPGPCGAWRGSLRRVCGLQHRCCPGPFRPSWCLSG